MLLSQEYRLYRLHHSPLPNQDIMASQVTSLDNQEIMEIQELRNIPMLSLPHPHRSRVLPPISKR